LKKINIVHQLPTFLIDFTLLKRRGGFADAASGAFRKMR
jgi:hypothetical protein